MTKSIQKLKGVHKGETVWIIGKGPSLAYLKKSDIGNGPIITLNQALIKIEEIEFENKIYSMQKDGCATCAKCPNESCESCKIIPKKAALIVHKYESGLLFMDYEPRYVFDCKKDFGLHPYTFSAIVAIIIGIMMGCSRFVFVSFDACTNGSIETEIPGGIKIIDPNLYHMPEVIKELIKQLKYAYEWLTPCAY
jgi:hypothetical protein